MTEPEVHLLNDYIKARAALFNAFKIPTEALVEEIVDCTTQYWRLVQHRTHGKHLYYADTVQGLSHPNVAGIQFNPYRRYQGQHYIIIRCGFMMRMHWRMYKRDRQVHQGEGSS